MGTLKHRVRFSGTLDRKTDDTLARMNFDTMIDKTKIANKAIDEYLIRNGYELRLNTEDENNKIAELKNK